MGAVYSTGIVSDALRGCNVEQRTPLKLNDYKVMIAEREEVIKVCEQEIERLRLVSQELASRLRSVRKAERNLSIELDSRIKYVDLLKDRVSKFYPEE